MRYIVYLFILTSFILLFNACSTYPYVEYPKRLSKKSFQEEKNYTLNEKGVAFVGQPLFRLKNKPLIQHEIVQVNFKENLEVKVRGRKYFIDSSEEYYVGALLDSYSLIRFDMENTLSYQDDFLVVDGSNNLIAKIWNNGKMLDATFSALPEVTLTPKKLFLPDKYNKNTLNIELLYNGKNNDGIKLLYREYTSDDFARPAFYQNLIYDADENEIRFKNFLIQIHSANNQEIIFTILRDNFKQDSVLIK
nr:hypothetical protein [uncultured Sulfurimonas sp.]